MTENKDRPFLLIADDETRILTAYSRVFVEDYNLILVTSGEAALEVIRNFGVDYALLDNSMNSKLSGLDVLRTKFQDVENDLGDILGYKSNKLKKIVLNSCTFTPEIIASATSYGAHCLEKPPALEVLKNYFR